MQTPFDRVPPRVLRRAAQRGAAGVFLIISLLLLVPILALALNIGQLYFAQRDLEKQATLAALSGVQVVSGCVNQGVPGLLADVTAEVNRVIGLNLVGNPDGAASVEMTGINGAPAVEIGRINVAGGLRQFEALPDGDARVTAVRVNLTRPQPTPFLIPFGGGFGGGSAMLFASATAQQAPIGTFSVGSSLLALNGGVVNGLLGGLLCAPGDVACQNAIVSANVLSGMQGLLNTSVSLGQLATAVGLSVTDLSDPVTVAATTPVLTDVLDGLVSALSGTAEGAALATLQGLANAASNPNTVPLGDLLGVVDGLGGDTPVINLFDLLVALGQSTVADPSGVTPIALPINLNVPGVATVSTFLSVLESPRLGVGRAGEARAETAQVRILIRIAADPLLNSLSTGINNLVSGVLNLLGLLGLVGNNGTSILPPPLNLGIDVTVAGAAAELDRLRCPTIGRADPIAELSVQTSTANVEVGTFAGAASSAPPLNTGQNTFPIANIRLRRLLGLINVERQIGLQLTGVGVGNTQLQALAPVTDFTPLADQTPRTPRVFRADGVPPDAPVAANPQTVGSPTTVQLNLQLTQPAPGAPASLLDALLGVVASIQTAVNPLIALVNGLTTSLIDPLLALLGIQLGTGTVMMQAAQIGQPVLVTTCLPGTAACP